MINKIIKPLSDPDYALNDNISGITFSREIAKWLGGAGWDVQRNSADTSKENISDLKAASKAFKANQVVFLFIKAKSLTANIKKSLWWGVDHWVTLTSAVKVRVDSSSPWQAINSLSGVSDADLLKYEIEFEIYSWGDYMPIGTKHSSTGSTLNVKQWLNYYYGYIASKPPV